MAGPPDGPAWAGLSGVGQCLRAVGRPGPDTTAGQPLRAAEVAETALRVGAADQPAVCGPAARGGVLLGDRSGRVRDGCALPRPDRVRLVVSPVVTARDALFER